METRELKMDAEASLQAMAGIQAGYRWWGLEPTGSGGGSGFILKVDPAKFPEIMRGEVKDDFIHLSSLISLESHYKNYLTPCEILIRRLHLLRAVSHSSPAYGAWPTFMFLLCAHIPLCWPLSPVSFLEKSQHQLDPTLPLPCIKALQTKQGQRQTQGCVS